MKIGFRDASRLEAKTHRIEHTAGANTRNVRINRPWDCGRAVTQPAAADNPDPYIV